MKTRGISLLEVVLAGTAALLLFAGGIYAYQQHMRQAQITKAKLMLASLRQGIAMQRYRTGSYPALGTYTATPSLRSNTDDQGRAFYNMGQNGALNVLLVDPIYPNSTGSPILSWGATSSSTPWGGWHYNANTGEIRANLPDRVSPGDPPTRW